MHGDTAALLEGLNQPSPLHTSGRAKYSQALSGHCQVQSHAVNASIELSSISHAVNYPCNHYYQQLRMLRYSIARQHL